MTSALGRIRPEATVWLWPRQAKDAEGLGTVSASTEPGAGPGLLTTEGQSRKARRRTSLRAR